MTYTNLSIPFVFRSKFENLITDENRPVITEAFFEFFKLLPKDACELLWRLTYEPDYSSFTLEKIGLSLNIISLENISLLRNELRFQYKEKDPTFLNVDLAEECQEAYQELVNHSDVITAAVVYNHCQSHICSDVVHILSLLNNDMENKFYGGIRSLSFCKYEAIYLKPFHKEIHNLLKAMYENYQKQCGSSSFSNTPFTGLAKMIEANGNDLPYFFGDGTPSEEPAHTTSKSEDASIPEEPAHTVSPFRRIYAESIIMYRDFFMSFVMNDDWNMLLEIGKLGFDLNEVMVKKEKICIFLEAVKAKEEAEAKLFKAVEALNN